LLEKSAGRLIVDQHDAAAEYYEKLKQKAEKHYRNRKLKLLQGVMREIGGLSGLLQDDSYLTFIIERTGYDAEIVKQILLALPAKNKGNEVIIINDPDISHKWLAEIFSPDNKRKITVRETSWPPNTVVTTVDLQFERSGSSVYMVEGADLDINVYWKGNNTVIIETRVAYVAISKHAEQYQSFDDIVKVEYVVR
jgi:hypothetical protein